jgi:protein SCO1/2
MAEVTFSKQFLRLLFVGLTIASLWGCNMPEAAQPFKSTNVTGIDSGKDFHLTDHLGKPRTLSDFKGKIVILFFGYTNCPEACPNTLSELARVMKLLGTDAAKVQVLFVTLDPERDTQALLAKFVPSFNPNFIGLYGTQAQTAETAKEYHLFYSKEPGKSPGNYTLDHSVGSYIYDTSGRLRLHAAYGQGVDALVHDIKLLLN